MLRAVLLVAVATALSCSRSPSSPTEASPPRAEGPSDSPSSLAVSGDDGAAPSGVRLPRTFRPTASRVRLAIDPDQPVFRGEVEIDGALSAPSRTVWLNSRDLTIRTAHARSAGREVELTATPHAGERLALRAPEALPEGVLTLRLSYEGTLEERDSAGAFRQRSGDAWYVFSQLEAIYARRVFPAVDEPDAKIPWQVTLDVPAAQVALSNTSAVEESALDGGWKRVRFAETRPMPSYLVAFAIGPFDLVNAGTSRHGVRMRIAVPRGRSRDAAYAAQITPRVLAALEAWFGTPYPYDKLDSVVIPVTTGFSAMENAGLITYGEPNILIDPADTSLERRHRYAEIATHEIAHQWFGNLVTTAWWDDIWLNEAFASWMAFKVMATAYPQWGTAYATVDTRATAAVADSLATARAIRQPIATVDDIDNAFDRITYRKGASMLSMFERWVGPAVFQKGVRAYLAKHAWGNATAADFAAAIGEAAGRDVWPAFATFLDRPGIPRVAADLRCETGKPPVVTVTQTRSLPRGAAAGAESEPWKIPVCVVHDAGGGRATSCALVEGATADIPLRVRTCPRWMYPNADGAGYYRSALTEERLDAVVTRGWARLTPAERGALFTDVVAMAERGDLPITAPLLLVSRMAKERSRFVVGLAAELVQSVEGMIPAGSEAAWKAWIVRTIGPEARRRGWNAPGADLDRQATGPLLASLAADAGDPVLRRQAIGLSRRWRTLPSNVRLKVLTVAVDDPAVFQAVMEAAVVEPDRKVRGDLLVALAHSRDPDRLRQALGLMLDPRLDARDTEQMDKDIKHRPGARDVAAAFVRENLEALLRRWPPQTAARHVERFTRVCDPARRDDIAAFVTRRFSPLPGGPRRVAQAIEQLDQCIAQRAQHEASLRAWLAPTR